MSPDTHTLPATSSSQTPPIPRLRRLSDTQGSPAEDGFHQLPHSPRSPASTSLQAAAATNAGLHRTSGNLGSNISQERRRSSVAANLILHDPALPGPGEMQSSRTHRGSNVSLPRSPLLTADPYHQHHQSLGQLHQQIESEQEAQVVRQVLTKEYLDRDG